MKLSIQFWLTSGISLCNLFALSPSQAQIVPDATLPNNSNVTTQGNISTITEGTKAGPNLFHSFQQFSVPTGSAAYFNNAPDIQNIISRVTGLSVSSIDGLIRANASANLFLLNPNGIIFGPNASLNIGGSFLASTASSLKFADGTNFSAAAHPTTPLLTINVPIGLQFGSNPGEIRVLGNGNNIVASNYQPIIRGNNSTAGLKVQPQQTLAIVGGDVSLEGGILTADGGRIELGSVDNGLVSLSPGSSGWSLGYEEVDNFKDIRLAQRALADASGVESGSIQVQGRRLQLSDGSLVLIQNQGLLPTGTLKVNASESLEIRDIGQIRGVYSGIWSETLGFGDGGEIAVSTPKLTIRSSGQIFSGTFGAAKAANITLSVPKSLRVIGLLPTEVGGGAILGSLAIGSGRSGDITISAGQLNIVNGGLVLTANVTPVTSGVAVGGSGDITISATDFVEVNGTAPSLSVPSAISAATFSTGSAGNVTVNTSRLRVRNGGRVDSSTTALGTAGSVTINASDSVEVSGVASGSREPSLVTSTATILAQSLQDTFRLSRDPRGDSGNVSINTKRVTVRDGGQLSVRNEGNSNAGTLKINANSINLDNQGGITATTASGEGGDITLNSKDILLRDNSSITATAGIAGTGGDGGNITINADTLAALENSDITADAFEGQGGNIQINTQGIFRSPNSDITASSLLGINGTVEINTPDVDLSSGLVKLPAELVDASNQIAQSCPGGVGPRASKFVITGRGGLPENPNEMLNRETVWTDERLIPLPAESPPSSLPASTQSNYPTEIVEANGWIINSIGEVILTASPRATLDIPWIHPSTCHAS